MNEQWLDKIHIEKICAQVDLPQKPKLGTVGKWLFLCISIIGIVFGMTRTGMPGAQGQEKWNMLFAAPFILLAIITLGDIIMSYMSARKEYEFSRVCEREYRVQKAVEFLEQNEENKKYSKLIHDFYTEYPQMWERMERRKKWGYFRVFGW